MDCARTRGEAGCASDERPPCSSPADAQDRRTRTGGIGDAEVAVLQGEPGDPVARRASVHGLRAAARAAVWGPCWLATCRVTATVRWPFDALNHIGSRHVSDDPHPPTAVRAEAEIDREHSAEALHPRHGCGGQVLIAFGLGSTKRLRAGVCMAATPTPRASHAGVPGTTLLRCRAFGAHSRDGPVVADQVAAWPRHQRRQPGQDKSAGKPNCTAEGCPKGHAHGCTW